MDRHPKPHTGVPLWNTSGFTDVEGATSGKPWNKPCRFSGTKEDYWDFLGRVERICSPFSGGARSRVGMESHVGIPPILFTTANTRYWLKAARDQVFYLLGQEVVQAIHETRLTWIDAEAFASLPDAFGVIVEQPGPGFQLYSQGPTGDWHDVQDLLLLRVKDADNRARLCDNLNVDPDDDSIQIFNWIAGSLGDGKRGALNWGTFAVSQNMKITQLAEGIESLQARMASMVERIGPIHVDAPLKANQTTRDFYREINATQEGAFRDFVEGGDQQKQSMAACVNFLVKVVLLLGCEGLQAGLEKVPPPGIKAMPRKARKLLELYGNQVRVKLPPLEDVEVASDEAEEGLHDRKSPVRHFVPGFFRKQPYGPGNGLRRVQWIRSFWRGRIELAWQG